jgi:acyl dehydratase
LHLDEVLARRSRFKRRIAHGMLTLAKLGAIVRDTVPGKLAALEVSFMDTVGIGDDVVIEFERAGSLASSTLDCQSLSPSAVPIKLSAAVGETVVLAGAATIETDLADVTDPFMIPALCSAVLGSKFPGPGSVYLGQKLRFNLANSLRAGDEVETIAVCAESRPAKKGDGTVITIDTFCRVPTRGILAEGRAVIFHNEELAALLAEHQAAA